MPHAAPRHGPAPVEHALTHDPRQDGFYARAPWRRLRRWFLHHSRQAPLCVECGAAGRTELATDVDHIVPRLERPDLALDPANLQGLCRSCHARKTRRQAREAAGKCRGEGHGDA